MSTATRTGIAVADFLLDRYAEDHETAWGAAPSPWVLRADGGLQVDDRHGYLTAICHYGGTLGHVLRFDPTAVIASINAKRAVVHQCLEPKASLASSDLAYGVLWALAQEYRDHPEFRQEWKP